MPSLRPWRARASDVLLHGTGTGTADELTRVNNHRPSIFLASPSRDTWLLAVQNGCGPAPILCDHACKAKWSTNGDWLFVQDVFTNRADRGRSLAIPVGPGEHLPDLPPTGFAPQASAIPGAVSVARDDLIPGKDPAHFAYVNTTVHRNLYRISLR